MKKEFEKEQKDNQIDDAFLDMPDMEDDEKFRQWLEEEYLKEADAIEEALFDGRKFEDNQDIVEKLSVSRENFYQRAREEGLLEDTADEKAEDEKNTEEAVPESTEKKILEFRKNAGVSKDPARDANRKYLVNSVRILSGNDSQFISYNDDSNENASTKESDAIADIEEKLDVKMPEFYYRPYGMEFVRYEIEKEPDIAKVEYEYNENIILFYVNKQSEYTSSNNSSLNGNEKTVDKVFNRGKEIIIKTLEDETDEVPTYIANWENEDIAYYIAGKIELKELKKILKEMKF